MIIKRVEHFIEKYSMIMPHDHVVCGVSGGADSMCLLFLLYKLREKLDFELSVVHVEHGIRGEASKEDARYVERICSEMGVSFKMVEIDAPELARIHGETLEEAARNARYKAFDSVGADKIAVAHHAGDVAETLLFNLFRGSSINGMGSIAPVRGKVIRPLLQLTKTEIIEFCKSENIEYRTDATNFDNEIARNSIRNQILPLACEINKGALSHLASVADDMREWNDYIASQVDIAEEKYCTLDKEKVYIKAEIADKEKNVIISEVVRRCIEKCSHKLKDITKRHVMNCVELLGKQSGREIRLPYGITVRRSFDRLEFISKPLIEENKGDAELVIVGAGNYKTPVGDTFVVDFDDTKFSTINIAPIRYTKWFDYDKICKNAVIRTRRPGDYMTIKGGRKKLKDILIEAKIPADKRDSVYILADGSHIMWVPGVRMSEYYKIDSNTAKILKVEKEEKKYNGRQN
ncbi:MAG: tRNA lysidine(34) synthetase TilS [Lachnospiraceae bacterium]|nr:tRNA lysidine(34) synthetase TilS [Lachnospiraceae bacterium]